MMAWTDWPVVVWLLGAAALWASVRYVGLVRRRRRRGAGSRGAEDRLGRCAEALHRLAAVEGGRLPADLGPMDRGLWAGVVYRPVPRLDLDARLMLLHGAEPTHWIVEFPSLKPGRAVVFCTGRQRVVTDEVFAELIRADDALRDRLGLSPVERPARPPAQDEASKEPA